MRDLAASLATGELSKDLAETLIKPDAYDSTYAFLQEDAAFFKSMGVTKDIFAQPFNGDPGTHINFAILRERINKCLPTDVYKEYLSKDTSNDKSSKLNFNMWLTYFGIKTNVTLDEFAHGL